ncbi:MAG TPA: hypothetical protein VHB50_13085, partial [Bryobacteraceae bacterium]|nr:hypothetical protein [Bryobacteraceae bacterium]
MTPFRQLLRIFRDRFRENDAVSPGAGFETGIHFLLGYLSVPGLFVAMYLVPRFMELSFYTPGPAVDWELRSERLFFAAYSFAAVGFATVFEWDMLFPDRRDFLILAPFPIRLRDLFGAKVAALGLFLLAIVAAVSLWPVTLIPIFSACIRSARAAGVLRLMLAQVANIGLAAAFAFFLVAALQGLLINLTSPRFFRRISPWVQMIGMSVMVLSILLFPIYSMAMRPL